MTEFTITEELVEAIEALQNIIYKHNVHVGWHDKPRSFGDGCALIHTEISEAFEGYRKDLMDDHLPWRKMAEVEMADVLIRVLDESGLRNFDLAGAMQEKFNYNKTRADHKRENRAKEGGKKL